jgi:hypothetical protein
LSYGFYWLIESNESRGGLAGMPCPEEADLEGLSALGIGLIVSLLESSRGNYRLPVGMRLARLPIDDEHAPAEAHLELVEHTLELVHRFRLQSRENRGVAVHCLHGRGRTGLFLAAYRAYGAVIQEIQTVARPLTRGPRWIVVLKWPTGCRLRRYMRSRPAGSRALGIIATVRRHASDR